MRILYVDDEADIREVAAMALELEPGFEVRSCASGAEALAVVTEWHPDLILLDVMMPQMDGPAVLARLRQRPATADTPVLFVTARTQQQEVAQLRALGAQGVIAKPFDPMTLGRQARDALG
ncbi:response regulator [Allosphingosinicella indica]|uniref:Response regulator receiver domain-containing protein n=1 Tax=Allosphingosinicella indica TaxID=941907 RepID=A0A1X7FYM6_9SPHN|nr:response regulator [Allosphingosinicella indica]SMF61195.1 Response regulator receiver domain-containing protein [Allosphingosinicella indica]